jgi:RNA polymerase sigma-70 factor (ECF subfamily)
MEELRAVERLQRGDIGGLEFLVQRFQDRALRAAYLVTHEASLAQDVVQAAFVKAFERIGQFDATRPFGPWFLRSVINDAIKAAARRDRHGRLDEGGDGDEPPDAIPPADRGQTPEALWEQAETAEEVWAAMRQLTPRQRAAIVSRYFLDQSEAEMAASLNCSTSTVKWRLHAARERLRILLRPLHTEKEST